MENKDETDTSVNDLREDALRGALATLTTLMSEIQSDALEGVDIDNMVVNSQAVAAVTGAIRELSCRFQEGGF